MDTLSSLQTGPHTTEVLILITGLSYIQLYEELSRIQAQATGITPRGRVIWSISVI